MKWGITCFFDDQQDFAKVAELAPLFPIDYLEIRGERPFFSPEDITDSKMEFFKGIIHQTGLRVTLHATFYDINLSTLNPHLREAVLKCYKKYLDLGSQIGAEILVVHGGHINRDIKHLPRLCQLARSYLVENLRILGEEAARRGLKIGLENSPPNPHLLMVPDSRSQVEILNEVSHSHVGAVWDMAHAYLHSLDLDDYYLGIKDYLLEIHAHNNYGVEDSHLAMNQGRIDYAAFFKRQNIEVPVIMEIGDFAGALASLEWIKNLR
ncbi:MAG: hypothetical protein Kow0042_12310 [Calditrichia bacterium]